jgi:hypothetical protein
MEKSNDNFYSQKSENQKSKKEPSLQGCSPKQSRKTKKQIASSSFLVLAMAALSTL